MRSKPISIFQSKLYILYLCNYLRTNIYFMDFRQIASAIKKRREFLGLTQLDLSELSEVALRTVNGFESGKASVTLNNLAAMAETLGMELQLDIKKPGYDLV